MSNEYKWVRLLGFKGGMRYFRDTLTDKVAAADNSGKYPDQTDDGVLWLNLDAAVTIELGSREYSRVTVPVKSERNNGKGYYCGEEINHLGEFLPLWTSLGGKVELHLVKVNGKEVPCFGPDEAAPAKSAPVGLKTCARCEDLVPADLVGPHVRVNRENCPGLQIDTAKLSPPVGEYSRTYFAGVSAATQARRDAGALAQGGSQPEPQFLPLALDVRDIALLRAALVAYERVVERAKGMTDGDRKAELVPVEDLRRRLARAQESVEAAIIATVVNVID